jgi:dolichol-phosphate mannosyltransferase
LGHAQLRLSIVLPTRNERGNVRSLAAALSRVLSAIDHEVIVVDDSTDSESRPALAELASERTGWRVIERPPDEQSGLATAVAEGLSLASGEAICVMDADHQHPPELVPALLAEVESGRDLAIASRYARGGRDDGLASPYRRLVSRVARLAAYVLLPESRRTTDPMTGFFCIRRSVVANLELRPVGFKILLELLVLRPSARVVDVPFVFGDRADGSSKASARQGLLYLRHLGSLFFNVPTSSGRLKFGLFAALSLGVFELAYLGLHHTSWAWALATLVSLLGNGALQRWLTQRPDRDGGVPYRAFGATGLPLAAAAYLGLSSLFATHPVAVGTAATTMALILPRALSVPALQRWAARLAPRRLASLEELGHRLGADLAWWSAVPPAGLDPRVRWVGKANLDQFVQRAAQSGVAELLVETVSGPPQPRRNLESVSIILVPQPHQSRVAVLARRRRRAFDPGDLDEAVRWLNRIPTDEKTAAPSLRTEP